MQWKARRWGQTRSQTHVVPTACEWPPHLSQRYLWQMQTDKSNYRNSQALEKSFWSRIRKWELDNAATFFTESKVSRKPRTKSGEVRNNGKKENQAKEKQALLWEPTPSSEFPKSANLTSETVIFSGFVKRYFLLPNGFCALLQHCCSQSLLQTHRSQLSLLILYREILQLY